MALILAPIRPTAMATRKRKAKASKAPVNEAGLYLLCFTFHAPGEEAWDGSFQLVVEATGADDALEKAATRLRELRTSSELFDSPTTLYLEGGILLRGSFEQPVLVNWEQHDSRGVAICNLKPNQGKDSAESFLWEANEDQEGASDPFLDFGGRAFHKALDKATKRSSSSSPRSFEGRPLQSHSSSPPIRPTQPRTVATAPLRTKKEVRRKRALKKAQRNAVRETLAEMKRTPEPR